MGRLPLVGLLVALAAAGGLSAYLATRPAPAVAAKKLFVTGVLSGVTVVDLATGKELERIDTGLLPHNLILSPDGRKVYVTNVGSQAVSVIDVQTLKKEQDILVGQIPANPQHTAYERVHPGELAKATSCFQCHTKTATGSLPNAMAWAPDGQLMVNAVRARNVSWLDVAAGKTTREVQFGLPTPSSPANMFVHPTSQEIWVVHRFEAPEYRHAHPKQPPGDRRGVMGGFAHDPPAGQHTSWVTVHDPTMTQELARVKMDLAVAFDGVFSPDGRWFYVAYRSSNQIVVFDTATHQVARTIKTGVSPVGIALRHDGQKLYVACLFSDPAVLQVIDVATGEIEASLGVPPSPSIVVEDPVTGRIYVTATGSNMVLEIDPLAPKLLRKLPAGHQPLDVLLTG